MKCVRFSKDWNFLNHLHLISQWAKWRLKIRIEYSNYTRTMRLRLTPTAPMAHSFCFTMHALCTRTWIMHMCNLYLSTHDAWLPEKQWRKKKKQQHGRRANETPKQSKMQQRRTMAAINFVSSLTETRKKPNRIRNVREASQQQPKRKWNQATVTRFSLEQFDLQFRLSLNVYMTRVPALAFEMVLLIKK